MVSPTLELSLPTDAIRSFCQQHAVRELAVFGSAVSGNLRPDSDLDFLVEFQPDVEVGFMKLARMQRELSALAKRRVDLVPKTGLKAMIRTAVLSTAQVIYAA